jgi:signal transduction histidine kinase
MAEGFPTTPRASRAVRTGAIAIGLLAIGLATRTTLTSTAWVGKTFPGFLVLDNRVVASISLGRWPANGVPGLFQSQVLAVDGRPVSTAAEIYAQVATQKPPAAVRYEIQRDGVRREVTVATATFTWSDWLLLFGAYLLNSGVYLACGLMVWVLRPRAPLGRALLLFGTSCALWMVTAMDIYGPATLFRLHVVGESIFPAASFHLGLLFPNPHPWARYAWVGYVVSLALLVPYQALLYDPTAYTIIHNLATLYLGCAGVFFGFRLVREYWRGRSQLVRQRIRVMTLGTLVGFALPSAIFVASAVSGGAVAVNTGAFTGFLFAVALAYAIVKHDLFEIDAMVKRGAYYLLLTGAVGAAYVTAVVLFNLILQAGDLTDSPAFPLAFTIAVLVLFNPLRTRLQAFVDRVFFRTRYDAARVLASVGADLVSARTREQVAQLVRDGVESAIPNGCTRLFVRDDGELCEVGGRARVPRTLDGPLAQGRVLTAFDSPESYADVDVHSAVRDAFAAIDAEVAAPLVRRGEVVGVLTAGAKPSGLFYTAGDAGFLRGLASQAAIALENAASYEELVDLNTRLEERVAERTAQLARSNTELATTLDDLREAHVQLVQSEKMASLGRLVAGVAHEINNPVSFIATSVPPLRRRLERAAEEGSPAVQKLLGEAQDIVGIMARGAERTASIVKDLRSFSRLGEATRKPVDLHEGLDVSLRLLDSRWRDRITVHRDYGTLPLVECDAGQMNQVLMNVLANACDAIDGPGNIWITTHDDGPTVTITIRDDGAGMTADVKERIFEPFFTTKDVGHGTGLGLAISHGVVTAHGGRIEPESTPGEGTTFRIILPTSETKLDSVASGGR